MYRKIILMLIASIIITGTAIADNEINITKETYDPTILPDSPLYDFKIALENWGIEHQYFIIPDNNQKRITEKQLVFIQRRIMETQMMMYNNANIHAINNSMNHMQIMLMKLNGSLQQEIKTFRNEVKEIENNVGQLNNIMNQNEIHNQLVEIKHILDVKEVASLEYEVKNIMNKQVNSTSFNDFTDELKKTQNELVKKKSELSRK